MSSEGDPLMEVEGVSKHYSAETGLLSRFRETPDVQAVDDVSFEVREGETFAVLGESGCGKSALVRTVLQLDRPTGGRVTFGGQDLTEMSGKEIRPLRQDFRAIFQDPRSSLDPQTTVGKTVAEPMAAHGLHGGNRRGRTEDLLETVGLDADDHDRYPRDLSAEECRRVVLAHALSTDPDLVAWDEPVAGLDAPAQARILNTMRDIGAEFDLTYLLVTGDPGVARYVADRVAVMYLGHVVELAGTEELFENPRHPYTQALIDAAPVPDPDAGDAGEPLEGVIPDPVDPPSGCRFRTRCPELIRPGTAGVDPSTLDDDVRQSMLDSYEMTDREWENVLTFVRAVGHRSFELDVKPLVGEVVDEKEALGKLDRRFFDRGDGRPGGEAGKVIEHAAFLLGNDDWGEAHDLLREVFVDPSVCVAERPEYTVETERGDGRHFAACHLHREEARDDEAEGVGQDDPEAATATVGPDDAGEAAGTPQDDATSDEDATSDD